MAKRARNNGLGTTARRQAEGRGQGRGPDYQPWLKIHDVPSQGQANRVKSPLHNRVCHLMSKLEADWFFVCHALANICDIREQYPLHLEETLEVAKQLEIDHPTDPKSRDPIVVTTDFVLTFQTQFGQIDRAIAVKTSSDLASRRTLEKLEVERRYWTARDIGWSIVTEKELPSALVKNMRWLFPFIDVKDSPELTQDTIARVHAAMEPELLRADRRLIDITNGTDDRLGLPPGVSLSVARHLIANKIWPVDLHQEIDPRHPLMLTKEGGIRALDSQRAA